ncbi:MAG: metallophosphoesterase [Saprospiraceae bacterium]|nr:metallophosphoesterase [Saprospiraceae bacterium]MDZ4703438.1 metallophosphoesterase [Saprospiraceae bacterium]
MVDVIGDIHGYADKLTALLLKLGYSQQHGAYAHPERTVLFVGDYIDRGSKIRETLQIVRRMVEAGRATALMGNHEYNALCFHYQESEGGHLRKHLIKNILQHYVTLEQFQNRQAEYEDYLDWFKSLPLYYETESFRAVHACWDNHHIESLRAVLPEDRLTDELIYLSVKKGTAFHLAVEETLKGKEITLPDGIHFEDKEGVKRKLIRIKWWENPARANYKHHSVINMEGLPEDPIDPALLNSYWHYDESEKPVFFGHYWLSGEPMLFRSNVCCLDYSVAKDGPLVAYRFDGEQQLDASKFVMV